MDGTYLREEGVDDLTGERFCELQNEKNRELGPREGRGFLFVVLIGEQRGLFVNGRGGHE